MCVAALVTKVLRTEVSFPDYLRHVFLMMPTLKASRKAEICVSHLVIYVQQSVFTKLKTSWPNIAKSQCENVLCF